MEVVNLQVSWLKQLILHTDHLKHLKMNFRKLRQLDLDLDGQPMLLYLNVLVN